VFTCAHKRNVHQVHCRYKLGDAVVRLWSDWRSGDDQTRWNMGPCHRCDRLRMIVNLCREGLCKVCCTSTRCCSRSTPLDPRPPPDDDFPHSRPPEASGLAAVSTSLTGMTVANAQQQSAGAIHVAIGAVD
jgi:hypothetical protein